MREKLCGIYSITNIANGKRLVGQSNNIRNRWIKHKAALKSNHHENFHLQQAYNKYGFDSFRFEIVLLCAVSTLDNEEIRFIKEYQSADNAFGYNLTNGGKRYTFTEEVKQKIRDAVSGEKNHNFGKQLSEERIRKLAEGRKRAKELRLIQSKSDAACISIHPQTPQNSALHDSLLPTSKKGVVVEPSCNRNDDKPTLSPSPPILGQQLDHDAALPQRVP